MLTINTTTCLDCGGCIPLCPEDALLVSFGTPRCNMDLCTLCLLCIQFCPVGAIGEDDDKDGI